jgi:hypothetical protein
MALTVQRCLIIGNSSLAIFSGHGRVATGEMVANRFTTEFTEVPGITCRVLRCYTRVPRFKFSQDCSYANVRKRFGVNFAFRCRSVCAARPFGQM